MASEISPSQAPLRTYYASQLGCTLDCDVTTGLNASTGTSTVTDNASILQSILSTATATQGVRLVIDGGAAIGSCLYIPQTGNVTIEGVGPGAGLFVIAGSNASAIASSGFTYTSSLPQTGKKVVLRNLYVNANRPHNSSSANLQGNGYQICAVVLADLVECEVVDCIVTDSPYFTTLYANIGNLTVRNLMVLCPSMALNTDAIHVNGPTSNITLDGENVVSGDDCIALNAPESAGGNIANVTITNSLLNGNAMVRIYGNASYSVSQVVLSNCVGSGKQALYILDGSSATGVANEQVQSLLSNNVTFSNTPVCVEMGNGIGHLDIGNHLWLSPTGTNPENQSPTAWFSFFQQCTVDFARISNSAIKRTPSGLNPTPLLIARDNVTIQKFVIDGYSVENAAVSGYSPQPEPYLIDCQSGSTIQELVINKLSNANVANLVNPATGWGGIQKVSGPGVLAAGFPIPDNVIANNTPYISASGNYAGIVCIKLGGIVYTMSAAPIGGPLQSTPNRALGGIYQNTSPYNLYVTVSAAPSYQGQMGFQAYYGATVSSVASGMNSLTVNAAGANLLIGDDANVGASNRLLGFVVPPGQYYAVNDAYSTQPIAVANWTETQIAYQSLPTNPSRSVGSVYQNTAGTNLGLLVTVCLNDSSNGGVDRALIGATSSPATLAAAVSTTLVGNQTNNLTFLVPPSYYYQVTQSNAGTLGFWNETVIPMASGWTYSTPSRSFGTSYQNTSGRNLFVMLVSTPPNNGGLIAAYTSATSGYAVNQCVATMGQSGADFQELAFIVLPGYYYSVNSSYGSQTPTSWIEVSF